MKNKLLLFSFAIALCGLTTLFIFRASDFGNFPLDAFGFRQPYTFTLTNNTNSDAEVKTVSKKYGILTENKIEPVVKPGESEIFTVATDDLDELKVIYGHNEKTFNKTPKNDLITLP
jgi:hypothetical protein